MASNEHPLAEENAKTVPPFDIVAEQQRTTCYTNLFEVYTRLSDRQQDIMDEPSFGYCTEIMEADFAEPLKPVADGTPFQTDSIINKFGVFLWNMFDACESGSIGGDACRMGEVLSAAVRDILSIRSLEERIKHLLSLTFAISANGLWAFLERGDPHNGHIIFKAIANEWKKFFDPDKDPSTYNISEDIRQFAFRQCEGLQKMLKLARENVGEYATVYNFNFQRIPRKKKATGSEKENSSGNKVVNTTTKKKTVEQMKLESYMESIKAVEGVPDDVVFDSCCEVRDKMKTFLARDGMTKAALCRALGNINHNSLNRFLSAKYQQQSGNVAYKNGYIFFEKLRILEGKPKSSTRERNELETPSGFSFEKSKGGRPETFLLARF